MKNPIQMIKQCQANEEPYFILRGKDVCALSAIKKYNETVKAKVSNSYFKEEIDQIMRDFETFAQQEGVALPD